MCRTLADGIDGRMRKVRTRVATIAAVVLMTACASTTNVETGQNASEIDSGGSSIALTGADLGAVVPVASAEFLGESVRRTEALQSGKLTFVMSIEGSALFDGEVVRLEQRFDAGRKRLAYTLTPSGVLGAASGLDKREGIVDGHVVYLKSKRLAEELGVNTAWIRYEDPCGAAEVMADLPLGGADASTVLEALGAAGDVEEVGSTEIDGRRARHYRGEADLGTNGTEADVACTDPFTTSSLVAPVDVWIDEKAGVVLREEIRVGLADMVVASGEEVPEGMDSVLRGTVVFELTFHDLGAAVDIREPVQSQVTNVTKAAVDRAEAAIKQRATSG